MSGLIRLYPQEWRDRYGTEFAELVAIRPLGLKGSVDVVRGAIDAHLHPQVRRAGSETIPPERADLRVARRLGMASIGGVALWVASFGIMLMGPVRYDDQGAYRDGSAAGPFFLFAVVLLVGALVGQLIALPRNARVARLSGMAAIPCLLLFGLGPWMWPYFLIAMVCVTWLAVAAGRAGRWPPLPAGAVVTSCVAVIAIMGVGATLTGGDRMAGGLAFLLAGIALVPAWLGLSATLVVRPTGDVG